MKRNEKERGEKWKKEREIGGKKKNMI